MIGAQISGVPDETPTAGDGAPDLVHDVSSTPEPNHKVLYNYRRIWGLCGGCWNEAKPAHTYCQKCEDVMSNQTNARRRGYRKEGLCTWCKSPADGKSLCRPCATKNTISIKARKVRRQEAGRCIDCGIPSRVVRCPTHSQNQLNGTYARYTKRKKEGICPSCRLPNPDKTVYCASCLKISSAYRLMLRQKRVDAGLCVKCPRAIEPGYVVCRTHKLRMRKYWKARRQMMKDKKNG